MYLKDDPDVAAQMDVFIEEIGESESMLSFQCNLCAKVFKTLPWVESTYRCCFLPSNGTLPSSKATTSAKVTSDGRRGSCIHFDSSKIRRLRTKKSITNTCTGSRASTKH